MALIKCVECGKKHSDTAKSCPHCGYKKRMSKKTKIIIAITPLIIVFGALATLFFININKEEPLSKEELQKIELQKLVTYLEKNNYRKTSENSWRKDENDKMSIDYTKNYDEVHTEIFDLDKMIYIRYWISNKNDRNYNYEMYYSTGFEYNIVNNTATEYCNISIDRMMTESSNASAYFDTGQFSASTDTKYCSHSLRDMKTLKEKADDIIQKSKLDLSVFK